MTKGEFAGTYFSFVRKELLEKYGDVRGAFLLFQADIMLGNMKKTELDGNLSTETHAYLSRYTLPPVALFLSMKENGIELDEIENFLSILFERVFVKQSRRIRTACTLRKFSHRWTPLISAFLVHCTPKGETEILSEDSSSAVVQVSGCINAKIVHKYGCPEVLLLFCRYHEHLSRIFPREILLTREVSPNKNACVFRFSSQLMAKS